MPTTSSHSLPYPDSTDPADVPADIAALAEAVDGKLDAIAPGQITGPTSGQLLIANASGVVTGTSVTGDVTISNAGVTAIGAGAVGTTAIANSAVTTAKIDNGAVTSAKLAGPTEVSVTSYPGTLTARKYPDGLVVISGAAGGYGPISMFGGAMGALPEGYRTEDVLIAPVVIRGWTLLPSTPADPIDVNTYNETIRKGYVRLTNTTHRIELFLSPDETPPPTGYTGVAYINLSYHATS